MPKRIKHAEGTGEHSLCGMAFDAFESGDADEPIVFAGDGELVTCADCKSQIDHVRDSFKGYRYQPRS